VRATIPNMDDCPAQSPCRGSQPPESGGPCLRSPAFSEGCGSGFPTRAASCDSLVPAVRQRCRGGDATPARLESTRTWRQPYGLDGGLQVPGRVQQDVPPHGLVSPNPCLEARYSPRAPPHPSEPCPP